MDYPAILAAHRRKERVRGRYRYTDAERKTNLVEVGEPDGKPAFDGM
jgi:hypothetical protein